ncbi:MAG: hypothetical protein M3R49_00210 [Chloroflexota bacterium]|nr:hypothetical protein [Chloroflexota bacterium]
MDSLLGDLSSALTIISPFILLPAATGAAAAGILGRNRIAVAMLIVAVLAVVVPQAVGFWWVLTLPPT